VGKSSRKIAHANTAGSGLAGESPPLLLILLLLLLLLIGFARTLPSGLILIIHKIIIERINNYRYLATVTAIVPGGDEGKGQDSKKAHSNLPRCHRHCYRGVAGNKKGEFEAEAQFLSKLHTNNGLNLLKLLLKGTPNEAQFLKVAVSYCPRPTEGRGGGQGI
jgi:hypothetical protein